MGYGVFPSTSTMGAFLSSSPTSNLPRAALTVGTSGNINFFTGPPQTVAANSPVSLSNVMTILNAGNVGIGTTNPQNTLEVNGTAQVDGALVGPGNGAVTIGGSGIAFANGGGTQTTAWTGILCGGDYAEAVNPAGDKKAYAAGDVLVISDETSGEVEKSSEAYSTKVVGVFATKPGVIGRRESLPKDGQDLPMAMIGIVPTKVTTANGPIHRGDLLVTSSQLGFAMKGIDRNRMLGAVIGKAFGSLDSGTGIIEVVVTLQ